MVPSPLHVLLPLLRAALNYQGHSHHLFSFSPTLLSYAFNHSLRIRCIIAMTMTVPACFPGHTRTRQTHRHHRTSSTSTPFLSFHVRGFDLYLSYSWFAGTPNSTNGTPNSRTCSGSTVELGGAWECLWQILWPRKPAERYGPGPLELGGIGITRFVSISGWSGVRASA